MFSVSSAKPDRWVQVAHHLVDPTVGQRLEPVGDVVAQQRLDPLPVRGDRHPVVGLQGLRDRSEPGIGPVHQRLQQRPPARPARPLLGDPMGGQVGQLAGDDLRVGGRRPARALPERGGAGAAAAAPGSRGCSPLGRTSAVSSSRSRSRRPASRPGIRSTQPRAGAHPAAPSRASAGWRRPPATGETANRTRLRSTAVKCRWITRPPPHRLGHTLIVAAVDAASRRLRFHERDQRLGAAARGLPPAAPVRPGVRRRRGGQPRDDQPRPDGRGGHGPPRPRGRRRPLARSLRTPTRGAAHHGAPPSAPTSGGRRWATRAGCRTGRRTSGASCGSGRGRPCWSSGGRACCPGSWPARRTA